MEQRAVTANGVRVLSYSQPHLHSFCIGLYVKAGVLWEGPDDNGLTHFLEHILFRNLGGMPQRKLFEELESMGASFDACTYKEFVSFTVSATSRHFDACADLIVRLLAPLAASASDVAVERRRVQNEIREDDPLNSFDTFLKRETWGGTALARPILGSITGVAAMGLPRLRSAWEDAFRAERLCFYITGGFTQANLEHLCGKIGEYPLVPDGARPLNAPVPDGFGRRGCKAAVRVSREMPEACLSFDVEYGRYQMAEINLLDDILFRGTLSRIGMALSEDRGLVYSHDAWLDQFLNIGTMAVKFSVMQSKIYDAVRVAADVFRSMRESVTLRDISFHMPVYFDNYDMTFDDAEDLNWHMAYNNFILDNGLESIEHIKSLYRAVTPERLMEMANNIFRPENLVVAVECARGKCREDKLKEILQEKLQ